MRNQLSLAKIEKEATTGSLKAKKEFLLSGLQSKKGYQKAPYFRG